MAFCDQCGNELNENAKFCSSCGASVNRQNTLPLNLKIIKCPSYHANFEYEEDALHIKCEFCGADVVIDDDATELKRILIVEKEKDSIETVEKEMESKEDTVKNTLVETLSMEITSYNGKSFDTD